MSSGLSFSLRPITARIGTRGARWQIESAAREVVEISPEYRVYRPPAIALPDEIDRVSHFHEWEPSRDYIRQRCIEHLSEGEDVHAATAVYRLEDVLVADGCVYRPWTVGVITKEKRRPVLTGPVEDVGEAQLCTTHCGSIYFGDWLTVDIPIQLLAKQLGHTPLSISKVTFGHEPQYRYLFDLPPPPRVESIVRAKSLWLVKNNDSGMTPNRLARYQLLRDRLRSATKGPRRVFIDRGTWGNQRGLRNRDEVLTALSARGFEAIYPERMTVEELGAALSSAEICIGIEGSAMCHAALMLPPKACIFAFVPEDRFLSFLKWFTDAFGMRYAYAVGSRPEPGAPDIVVDIDRINRTLDLIESAL